MLQQFFRCALLVHTFRRSFVEDEGQIDIRVVQQEIEALESELVQVKAKMKVYLRELGVDA
jgi:hypothetical protein